MGTMVLDKIYMLKKKAKEHPQKKKNPINKTEKFNEQYYFRDQQNKTRNN